MVDEGSSCMVEVESGSNISYKRLSVQISFWDTTVTL